MAIAFDAASNTNTGAASSVTYAHTCTGSDRVLFVQSFWSGSRTVSGMTYNSVSMSTVVTTLDLGGGERHGLYYLVAPATGTNNVVLTLSGSTAIESAAVSYTGVAQTGTLDNTLSNTTLETGQASQTASITTVADNCWVLWCSREYAGTTLTAGTNTAIRNRVAVQYGIYDADTNSAQTPPGSKTLTVNSSPNGNFVSNILVSFPPSASAATNSNFLMFMS